MFVDENKIVNESEIETVSEPVEGTVIADDNADEEFETDLEIDENGDVVIPEDEGEELAPEEEEISEEEQGDGDGGESADEADTVAESAKESKSDDRDRELAVLRRKLAALESQAKDTLEKLGVRDGDVTSGLVKLAAEASDETPEAYLKKKAERDRTLDAVRLLQTTEFNKKAAADLLAVQAAYPETKKFSSIKDIPNFKRFGELRDMGLSPKEAYIAANPDGARNAVAAATKRQALDGTKDHLKSSVSKRTKDTSTRMPRATLLEWRNMFPGYSDKEIAKLYKEAIN